LLRLSSPKVFLSFAFANQSASTTKLINDVEAKLDAAARERFVIKSDQAVFSLEQALSRGDFSQVVETTQALGALLAELGALTTPPMEQILALARSYEGTGKLSGAGAGDGCILFSPGLDARARLIEGLTSRGFFAMPVELEPGLRGETRGEETLSRWLRD
jgi:phosphomevalonate kinase